VIINLHNRSDLADHLVIATASSRPHLKAIADHVWLELKKEGILCARKGGDSESGWIAMDYYDVIVHLFIDEKRSYYAIEELWTSPQPVAKPSKKGRKTTGKTAKSR